VVRVTPLYERSGNRVPIHWTPDQTNLGKRAVENVVGTPDSYPVDVDDETAAEIRAEYQRLVEEQTSGGSA